MFSIQQITTLYLVPHSHTDIGYTHDPVMVWELQDRFLDQAIILCEATADVPAPARFHWTIEVFATLEHWWAYRDKAWHDRLLALMRAGRIDVGARRFNGTCLSDPGDIHWELERVQRFAQEHGVRIATAFNNDVNGFALGYAQAMARAGVDSLAMGLNTTMGISPFPRPNAWRWRMPGGEEVVVWNGFIYNRLKSFLNVEHLAEELPGRLDAFFAHYPDDYPFDFAMTSAVVDDNTGPIASLPEQVRRFNAAGHPLRLEITTISGFMDRVKAVAASLPVQTGDWTDAWSFYLGSLPQPFAAVRRAQRRLALVDGFRALGWACETGGSLTLDRARDEIAIAAEHTNGSHSASGEPDSSDTQRQWGQIAVNAWNAESMAMVLLRDHLAALAHDAPEGDAVCLANPTPHALATRVLYEAKGFRRFADLTRPEHLLQFDREPTRNAFVQCANFGIDGAPAPPASRSWHLLGPLALVRERAEQPIERPIVMANDVLSVTVDPAQLGLVSLVTKADGREWLAGDAAFAGGSPVLERLVHPRGFQVPVPDAVRDPSDTPWTRDHQFARTLFGRVHSAELLSGSEGVGVALQVAESPFHEIVFRLDVLRPEVVEITVRGRLDDDLGRRGIYLPFAFAGEADCRYWYDSAGEWVEAGRTQLPGSATSHYASWRGVALQGGAGTAYLAARDTVLWQFGGFTFGHPHAELSRKPFAAAWLYNNYWFCNVPPSSPGGFEAQFLLACTPQAFDPQTMDALYTVFSLDDMAHPVQAPTER